MVSSLGNVEVEYFDIYGRADPIRLLLAYSGVAFKNVVVQQPDWPALKADTARYPHGGLPMVTVDGMRMGQTMSILRNFGLRLGHYPAEDAELAWNCDSVMDIWNSTMDANGGFVFAPEDKKEEAQAKLTAALTQMFDIVTERMRTNKWKYCAGNKITCADFCIFTYYCNMVTNEMSPLTAIYEPFYNAPELEHIKKDLGAKLADYLESRDKRPM